MNIKEIKQRKVDLDKKLQYALSIMERSDAIKEIRLEIIENQRQCPHNDGRINYAIVSKECPFCGFHFTGE